MSTGQSAVIFSYWELQAGMAHYTSELNAVMAGRTVWSRSNARYILSSWEMNITHKALQKSILLYRYDSFYYWANLNLILTCMMLAVPNQA